MKKEVKDMRLADGEASKGLRERDGGPFGAVIVRKGKIISSAHNEVLKTKDPTAHAEIQAIRKASKKLGRFDLSDCELYTSCEPCPMCLGAIEWARIKRVYYGATRKDAAKAGFEDLDYYREFKKGSRNKPVVLKQIDRKGSLLPFKEWNNKKNKIIY